MNETQNDKVIILDKRPFREKDSLVTVYAQKLGKLNLVARGTTKIDSKLSGHVEPLAVADIMIVRGRNFDYIGSAVVRDSLFNIKNDLHKIYHAGEIIKYFNKKVLEQSEDDAEQIFRLLKSFFKVLDTKEINDYKAFNAFFIFELLKILGHKPELERCINCGKEIKQEKIVFDFSQGGVVCDKCCKISHKINSNSLTISSRCVTILNGKNKFKKGENRLTAEAVNFICSFDKFQG